MKEISLTQGKVALVDDDDYEQLIMHKWHAHKCTKTFYACRTIYPNGRKSARLIMMHRQILGLPFIEKNSIEVDHKDLNGLNNQKQNLRLATDSKQARNHSHRSDSTSPYKGIHKLGKKYRAYIRLNGKRVYLGIFADPVDAAYAYDRAAMKHFGEFANLNFIGGMG